MFGWHISFEHRYFKSRRDEYRIRVWKRVKYKKPFKKMLSEREQTNIVMVRLVEGPYQTISDPRD